MLDNLHQTDIEEFTVHIDKFEKRGVDYFLSDIQIPSVSTILGSGGGGKNSYDGTIFHEAMDNLWKEVHVKENQTEEEKIIEAKKLFKDANSKDMVILTNLVEFMALNKLKPYDSECKFWHEVNGCKFAGTIDLLCIDKQEKLYVFDYKTGVTKDPKHHKQVATYVKSIGAIKGFICYRDEIVEVDLSLFEDEFKPLLLSYYGKLDGYINHRGKLYSSNDVLLASSESIKEKKLGVEFYKNQISELEKEINADKEIIIETLEEQESFKDNNILLTWTKGKKTESLKPDKLKELKKSHPDWFETKQSNGYYALRLAVNNANNSEIINND